MEHQHKLFYETRHTPLGNAYEVHSTHRGEELSKNIPIAEFLIDSFGGKLKLLPNNITNKNSRDLIMPIGVKEGKYPDALWNNEIWEFKTNTTGKISTLRKEIEKAHKQSNNVLIRFDYGVSIKEIYRAVKGEILTTKTLQKVWVLKNQKVLKFERKNLIKKPRKD